MFRSTNNIVFKSKSSEAVVFSTIDDKQVHRLIESSQQPMNEQVNLFSSTNSPMRSRLYSLGCQGLQ